MGEKLQKVILVEKPIDSIDAAKRRKISDAPNKFEALFHMAKNSDEGMDFLITSLLNMEEYLSQLALAVPISRQKEHEDFIDCSIPFEVGVLPLICVFIFLVL